MKQLRWIVWVALVAVVLSLPWLLHWMRAEHRLDMVVVDKTVPYRDYLEHRSLFWLLEHFNFVRSKGQKFDLEQDYIGTVPGPSPGDAPGITRDLTDQDLRDKTLVYLVDTYGVYRDDLVSGEAMRTALERSPRIYGGLTTAEATAVQDASFRGTTVVAEFNAFASPTGIAARSKMEGLLGVHWSGWIGRYFVDLDLDNEDEVPRWVVQAYEREWSRPWDFEGPGYVLLREDINVEVLQPGIATLRIGLTIEREEPIDPLLENAYDRIPYPYWFDIVEAGPETEVLARFEWHLRGEGEMRLADRALPLSFPAVTRRRRAQSAIRSSSDSYYFAGDFADNPLIEGRVPLAGYMRLRGWMESGTLAPSEESFFWRFYAPMIHRLLLEHATE